jgi:hypothetical protein
MAEQFAAEIERQVFPDHVDGAAARFVQDLRFVARYGTGTAQPVAYLEGEPARFF